MFNNLNRRGVFGAVVAIAGASAMPAMANNSLPPYATHGKPYESSFGERRQYRDGTVIVGGLTIDGKVYYHTRIYTREEWALHGKEDMRLMHEAALIMLKRHDKQSLLRWAAKFDPSEMVQWGRHTKGHAYQFIIVA